MTTFWKKAKNTRETEFAVPLSIRYSQEWRTTPGSSHPFFLYSSYLKKKKRVGTTVSLTNHWSEENGSDVWFSDAQHAALLAAVRGGRRPNRNESLIPRNAETLLEHGMACTKGEWMRQSYVWWQNAYHEWLSSLSNRHKSSTLPMSHTHLHDSLHLLSLRRIAELQHNRPLLTMSSRSVHVHFRGRHAEDQMLLHESHRVAAHGPRQILQVCQRFHLQVIHSRLNSSRFSPTKCEIPLGTQRVWLWMIAA